VLEINLNDNSERTLGECEVVHIKPGHAFCKKVRYKRGLDSDDRSTRKGNGNFDGRLPRRRIPR
jgi:hypothetical protein